MRLFFCNSSRASSKRGDYREVRSRITKYICSAPPTNLLSVLDPSSLASGIAVLFDSRTEAKQFASLVAQNTKTPEGVSVFWATTGNRTRITGTTNRSNDRYTIVAILLSIEGRARSLLVHTVIPIFSEKVECFVCC